MSLIVESLVSSSNSQILDDLSFKPENNHESGKTIITNNILLQEQNHRFFFNYNFSLFSRNFRRKQ